MAELNPQRIGASIKSLLQVPGGVTSALTTVEDGDGNPTCIELSSAGAKVNGDLEVTGSLVGSTTLSDEAPENLGGATSGSSNSASRADHRHAHGNLAGGSLHSVASTTVAGFMSAADKTKLDALPTNDALTTALAGKLATTGDASQAVVKGRTLDARAGDVANAKDAPHGAKGDGVTDDTASLQSALSTGKRVVIHGPGTYIISAPLVIPSGGELIGIGNPVIKLKSGCSPLPAAILTNTATNASRASNVRVEGVIFDGNRTANINHGTPTAGNQTQSWEGYPLAAISLGNIDGLTIRDCEVRNMWASGIWLVDCTDAVVDGCRITACRKSGIAARRAVPTASPGMLAYRITNNYVSGCTIGIHAIFGTGHGIISGNYCELNSDTQAYPSFAWGGTYPNVWPIGDSQTWKHYGDAGYASPVNQGDGAGIELTGYYTTAGAAQEAHITINANVCKSNANGVRVEQSANYVVVTDNVCTLNDAHGVFLFSSAAIVVDGNECSFNGLHGICVDKAPGQPQGAYQMITDNDIIRNNFFGLTINGSDSMLIQSNMFLENNQYAPYNGGAIGIFAASTGETSDNLAILDNYVNENGKYWVYADGAAHSNLSIRGNTFLGTPATAKLANVMSLSGVDVRGNTGFKTRNKGSATVNANSYVTVTHGLDVAPAVANIRVSPVTDPGSGARIYLSPTPNATTFDVIQAGGSGTTTIVWSVDDQ